MGQSPTEPALGDLLFGALALMLLFEGLLPFLNPSAWRRMFERTARMSDGQIRFIGLLCLATGVTLLFVWGAWSDAAR